MDAFGPFDTYNRKTAHIHASLGVSAAVVLCFVSNAAVGSLAGLCCCHFERAIGCKEVDWKIVCSSRIARLNDTILSVQSSLHVTDIHPDPFYRANSSVEASCHHDRPHDDPERAGWLGTPVRWVAAGWSVIDVLHADPEVSQRVRHSPCTLRLCLRLARRELDA